MKRKKINWFVILWEIPLFAYLVTLIFPFLWIILNSFKTPQEFFKDIWSIPVSFGFGNYANAWVESKMAQYFFNSIVITSLATILSILFAAMTGYVLSRYKFKGRNFIYTLAIASFLIPQVGTLAPFYIFMKGMNLFNPIGLLITYSGGMGTGMIILYSFFKAIPWDFAEAAFMDGAGHTTVFFKIMLPLAKNGIIPIAVINSIGFWNDYFIPSVLLVDKSQYTIGIGLFQMQMANQYTGNWTVTFAAIILMALPMLILYVALNKTIISGFTMGGLKG